MCQSCKRKPIKLSDEQKAAVYELFGEDIQNWIIDIADAIDESEAVETLGLPASDDRRRAKSTDAIVEEIIARMADRVRQLGSNR